jgi:hypothetical protein
VVSTLKFLAIGSGLAGVLVGGPIWLSASSPMLHSDAPELAPSSVQFVSSPVISDDGPTVTPTKQTPGESAAVEQRTPAPQPVRQTKSTLRQPMRSVGSAGPAAADASDLRAESRLIARARAQLKQGSATAALQTLEQARSRFPYGVLVQEREALLVEALARSGRRDEARARGSEFLRHHSSSPHASRVRDSLSK